MDFLKPTTLKSDALRKSAEGQSCMLQLDCCNHNCETTVLAHLPIGQKGMGIKRDDFCACFACSDCHDAIDGRSKAEFTEADLMRAWYNTLKVWLRMGLITIKGAK
jgi:hypothetical protein